MKGLQAIKYDPQTLINEYKEHVKNTFGSIYPALTDADINLICRYQFILLHRTIQSGSAKSVRIKYFGVFRVFKSRAIGIVNKAQKMFAERRIKQEDLIAIEEVANNALNQKDYGENTCD